MKFDKFVKMAGTLGGIVEYKGHKYLSFGTMMARVPENYEKE